MNFKDFAGMKVGVVHGFKYTQDFDVFDKFTKDESQ